MDTDKLLLGTASTISATRITVYIGVQYRNYLHARISPQGEGFPYVFHDISFLQSAEVPVGSTAALRFRFNDSTTYLYTRELVGGTRNRSFSTRRRGRSWQFKIDQVERDFILEVQEVEPRFRVRAPRRSNAGTT